MIQQRQCRQRVHHLQQRTLGGLEIDTVLAIERVDRCRFQEAIGEARGVGEQLSERDRAKRRDGLVVLGVAAAEHAHVGEHRQMTRNRIVELKTPLFIQHHDGDAGQRLGHGINAEHRVDAHRQPGGDIAHAIGIAIGHLPAPRH